ncbi:metalloprotease PmbA [Kangiella sp. TOML190]|uniref:metalloprotease PmbA n=1 Tax=Kangiella sp. TOML190 TaxID=2931351 RepID=UPI00203F4552|nr:metalloprotease PmbA [Kangiella sp. TOML190]
MRNSKHLTLAELAEAQDKTQKDYRDLVKKALLLAKQAGAEQAEIWCHHTVGNSIEVRNQELETLEFNQDSHLSLNLYYKGCKGAASINDLTHSGIEAGVKAALAIARFTEPDPFAGLAKKERLATDFPDLGLSHLSKKTIPQLVEVAQATEAVALANNSIKQSEGASVYGHSSFSIYANSLDFFADKNTSRYSLSTTMIAEGPQESMQRDGYYSISRDFHQIESPQQIGQQAAEKVLARLHQGKAKSGTFPVVFTPETARGIWSHLLSALKGGALYQKASFMLDKKGQQIVSGVISITEDPFIQGGFGSCSYDSEGVATYRRDIVADGILKDYFLSSYSARRLGLESTASAGGIHNILISAQDTDQAKMIKELGTGLLVTELMGQGVNLVTGNYSRGAGGFWFENGELQYFVQGITIAGNLSDMLMNVISSGQDVDHRSSILCGSLAIDGLAIATAS